MLAITLTTPPQWSPFSDEGVGIPHRLHKVVRGEVGAHRPLLNPALAARIDATWQRYVTPVASAAGYEEFIAALP